MEMLRWLATNKVVQTTWGLGILTMVMSSVFGGGNSDAKHEPAKAEAVVVEQVAEVKAVPEVTTEASVPVVQALVATEVDATEEVTEADAVEEVEVVEAAVEAVEAEVVAETEAAAEVSAEATDTAVEAVEAAVEPAEAEAVTEEAATEAEVAAVTEEVATETEAAAVTEEVATETEVASEADADGFADKSAADLLVMAREAYWNNGLEESAEIYKALIEREPTVIEHKGELGNVFWRQGYPKQAAELYAEIAAPMIEKGNGERVSNMVGFIGLFFPEKATEIRALLDAQ